VLKKHKVTVVRDSHARGCVAELTERLGKPFEVRRFVKPGASFEGILNAAKEYMSKLTKKDVVVVWGGTNDIKKNASSNSLKHITNFVKNSSHTNIFVMNAPHRHDWIASLCVNSEVKVFNTKVQKNIRS
jgi:hypothetical protein